MIPAARQGRVAGSRGLRPEGQGRRQGRDQEDRRPRLTRRQHRKADRRQGLDPCRLRIERPHVKEEFGAMLIHYGYELVIACTTPTPVVAELDVHPSRTDAVRSERPFETIPSLESSVYPRHVRQHLPALCRPAGQDRADSLRRGRGRRRSRPRRPLDAPEIPVRDSRRGLMFLLGSRYCETDKLTRPPGTCSADQARLGAGAGDLRLCPRPHRLQIRTRGPTRPPSTSIMRGSASAATTPTSPSPSAAA